MVVSRTKPVSGSVETVVIMGSSRMQVYTNSLRHPKKRSAKIYGRTGGGFWREATGGEVEGEKRGKLVPQICFCRASFPAGWRAMIYLDRLRSS